jgi:long-chain acyl-CoA synthetase
MHIDFLIQTLQETPDKKAIIWHDNMVSNQWLINRIKFWQQAIDAHHLTPGTVVALEGDFSPNSISLFLALTEKSCLIVPLHRSTPNKSQIFEIAMVEFIFHIDAQDEVTTEQFHKKANHELYQILQQRCNPGLILFSSGTSGKPKAAIHDFTNLLSKFKQKRKPLNMLNFLLFDHWGGLNTMLHTLSNGGTVLAVTDRSPDGICEFIEKHRIEVLPTSPTFLNLLLISEAYKRYDLKSLNVISYGTEPMALSTLKRMKSIFPHVRLQQTYGLIELGVLRSKSKSSDSLWVKIGGEGFETRVVDGILQIKAKSVMLGYLNTSSPFTKDGWYITGDSVEVDGEYIKILGRKSEMINVGGEKVYPAEVESVIQEMDNVADVTIYGEKNLITGNIVCAKIRLLNDGNKKAFVSQLKKHCREKLQTYKVPVKVKIVSKIQHSERYKKVRYSHELK